MTSLSSIKRYRPTAEESVIEEADILPVKTFSELTSGDRIELDNFNSSGLVIEVFRKNIKSGEIQFSCAINEDRLIGNEAIEILPGVNKVGRKRKAGEFKEAGVLRKAMFIRRGHFISDINYLVDITPNLVKEYTGCCLKYDQRGLVKDVTHNYLFKTVNIKISISIKRPNKDPENIDINISVSENYKLRVI